ncbi:hypothetical protein K3495_g13795 [Podosphaera aphanis]|nr:hypothetical protein K3495_g13795 [Podosphaera aphanis]
MTLVSRSDNTMIVFYSSLEEATQDEQSFALTNGYCLSIQRTNYVGNNTAWLIKSRIICCVHGGKHVTKAHIRSTTTLRPECPFQLKISKDEGGTRWSSTIINADHNHEAVDNVAAYPHLRTYKYRS